MTTDDSIERLRWQCRRGLLELDYVLLDYLERRYASAPADERNLFEQLLQQQDQDLQQWILDIRAPADPGMALIVGAVRRYGAAPS